MKIPSSSPITLRLELERQTSGSKSFVAPLSSMITQASFLSRLRVGIATLGFERTVSLRSGSRTVIVDYDPPIGTDLTTRGIAFTINLPENYVSFVCNDRPALVRDVVIQRLAMQLDAQMKEQEIPRYYLESVLSGVIVGLGLDHVERWNMEDFVARISSTGWINDAINATMQEGRYFERFDVDSSDLRSCLEALTQQGFSADDVAESVRDVLIHSMAHVILVAGCITSGSVFEDIGYLVNQDEVVLFDAVNGGNGSCEVIYDFLSSPEDFTISEFAEDTMKGQPLEPKHFDTALGELLLPCQQAVAERIFHADLTRPKYQEIARRIEYLDSQRTGYETEFREVGSRPITDAFQASIGYHTAVQRNIQDIQQATIAVARKMLSIMHVMLTRNEPYQGENRQLTTQKHKRLERIADSA
jgi:hypothetical protein